MIAHWKVSRDETIPIPWILERSRAARLYSHMDPDISLHRRLSELKTAWPVKRTQPLACYHHIDDILEPKARPFLHISVIVTA